MSEGSTKSDLSNAFTNDEEREMWVFIRSKMQDVNTGKITKLEIKSKFEFWEEFRIVTKGKRESRDYEKRFDYVMAPNLHKAPLGTRTKTELYFGMDIPVESNFLEYLNRIGEVEIDDFGCLLNFKEYRKGGMELLSERKIQKIVIKEEPISIKIETKIEKLSPEFSNFPPEVSQEPECSNAYYERQRLEELRQPDDQLETSAAYYDRLNLFLVDQDTPGTENNLEILPQPPQNPCQKHPFTAEEEMDMWIFLLQKLHNSRSGKVEKLRYTSKYSLWKEFKKNTKSRRRPLELDNRFTSHMAETLHLTTFDVKTKVELYYGLQLPVEKNFLEIIETTASIKLDLYGRIEKYSDDEGLILGYSRNDDLDYNNNNDNDDDDQPECSDAFYRRQKAQEKLYQISDIRTKSAVSIEVKPEKSRKSDDSNRFNSSKQSESAFVRSVKSLNSCENHVPPNPQTAPFTDEEEMNMWIFLIQELHNSRSGKVEKLRYASKYSLWKEFKKMTKSQRRVSDYENRFSFHMASSLHLTSFDVKTKVELYYGLQLPVERKFLEILETTANIQLDKNRVIQKYSDDEGLILGYSRGDDVDFSISSDDQPECSDAYYGRQKAEEKLYQISNIREKSTVSMETKPEKPRKSDDFHRFSSSKQSESTSVRSIKSSNFRDNPPSSDHQTAPSTDEEEMNMWIFLIQELHNSRSGKVEKLRYASKYSLWKEFKKMTKSQRRVSDYENRFSSHMASSLHLTSFDVKTKVELYYGLQLPVERKFLEIIETTANIQLDKNRVIQKYSDEEGLILGYSRSDDVDYSANSDDQPECSDAYYRRQNAEEKLYQFSNIREKSKVSLEMKPEKPRKSDDSHTFHSSKQSESTSVRSIKSSNFRDNPPSSDHQTAPSTDEEEMNMWIFLIQELHNSRSGKVEKLRYASKYSLWKEFKKMTKSQRRVSDYENRFSCHMANSLHLTSFDVKTKVELYYGLQLPVERKFLEILETTANIQLDKNRVIQKYSDDEGLILGYSRSDDVDYSVNSDDQPECSDAYYRRQKAEEKLYQISNIREKSTVSMEIKPEKPRKSADSLRFSSSRKSESGSVKSAKSLKSHGSSTDRPRFTHEEEMDMWIFLIHKIRNPMTAKVEKRGVVPSDIKLWSEFKTCSNGERDAEEYMKRFDLIMRDSLHMTRLTQQMKLELYYGLEIPVDHALLQVIEMDADVVVDRKGCLVMYRERRDGGEKFELGEEPRKDPRSIRKTPAKKNVEQFLGSSFLKLKTSKKNFVKPVRHLENTPKIRETPVKSSLTPASKSIPTPTQQASDLSDILPPTRKTPKRVYLSSDDSEPEFETDTKAKPAQKKWKEAHRPPGAVIPTDSEPEEDYGPPTKPKFIRQPVPKIPYEGPLVDRSVYLEMLKNLLEEMGGGSEELRQLIESKRIQSEGTDEKISVGYIKHLKESIMAIALYG